MTYYYSTGALLGQPFADISASIGWQSDAGTFLNNSATALANNVGRTLQTDVWTMASGAEIPSYNCTSTFYFSDPVQRGPYRTVAQNSVSWTCASEPVKTWCTYLKLLLKTDLASVSLWCKSHRFKRANITMLSPNSTHRRQLSRLCQSATCRKCKSYSL